MLANYSLRTNRKLCLILAACTVPLGVVAVNPAVSAPLLWDDGGGDNVIANNANFKPDGRPGAGSEGIIDDTNVIVNSTLYFANSSAGNGTYGKLTFNSSNITSILAANFNSGSAKSYSVALDGDQAVGSSSAVNVLSLGSAVTQTISISDSTNAALNLQLGQAESAINVTNASAGLTINSKLLSVGNAAFGLTKTGAGTLTLANATNSFGASGATVKISGGTVAIDTSAELGNAANTVTLNGGVLQFNPMAAITNFSRSVIVNAVVGGGIQTNGALGTTTNVTLTNLSGSGTLTKSGSARLILSSASQTAFSGNLTITAGAVQVKNTTSLGSGSAVTLSGTSTDNPTLDLRSDTSSNFGMSVEVASNGALANYGQVFVGNIGSVSGMTETIGAVTIDNGATFLANGTSGYGLNAGTVTLLGNNTINDAVGLTVVSIADTPGNSQLTKGNIGVLTVIGAANQGGATIITQGTLKLASTATMANTPSVNVGTGSTFDVSSVSGFALSHSQALLGIGTVIGALTAHGTVDAATNGAIGTLTTDGDLTLASDSTATFDIASTSSFDLITQGATNRTVTLNGNVIANFAGTFASGDSFKLFAFNAYAGSAVFTYNGLDPSLAASFDSTTGVVSLSVAPEPSTIGLMSIGLLSLVRRRRVIR